MIEALYMIAAVSFGLLIIWVVAWLLYIAVGNSEGMRWVGVFGLLALMGIVALGTATKLNIDRELQHRKEQRR